MTLRASEKEHALWLLPFYWYNQYVASFPTTDSHPVGIGGKSSTGSYMSDRGTSEISCVARIRWEEGE